MKTSEPKAQQLFWAFEVALDSSREALPSYTVLGGCCWLERDHEVAVFDHSADGLAMIKPAGTSSKNDQQAATVHPDESYNDIINQSRMHSKRCRLNKLIRHRLIYPVVGKSSRKHLKPTIGQPTASISLPPAEQPDSSTSSHPVLRPASGQPNTFEREEFVSNGLNSKRGLYTKATPLKDRDDCRLRSRAEVVRVVVAQKSKINRGQQQRENESEAKLSTIIRRESLIAVDS
ncbi:RNA pseudouridine synthase 3, mitochondrial [Dorcoceras hygrometricum]|uniref:RNA pseudouridine synthase 3, mitochondrial n=1 Tax=Dorcoceras hygrometricum TaxID=472368 RepID=A0A2Z7CRQ7_9LAMI|nr:RNA pseudouridine synthase 3, mitochondrial [Dorcoceras hygrometricum]